MNTGGRDSWVDLEKKKNSGGEKKRERGSVLQSQKGEMSPRGDKQRFKKKSKKGFTKTKEQRQGFVRKGKPHTKHGLISIEKKETLRGGISRALQKKIFSYQKEAGPRQQQRHLYKL